MASMTSTGTMRGTARSRASSGSSMDRAALMSRGFTPAWSMRQANRARSIQLRSWRDRVLDALRHHQLGIGQICEDGLDRPAQCLGRAPAPVAVDHLVAAGGAGMGAHLDRHLLPLGGAMVAVKASNAAPPSSGRRSGKGEGSMTSGVELQPPAFGDQGLQPVTLLADLGQGALGGADDAGADAGQGGGPPAGGPRRSSRGRRTRAGRSWR